MLNANILFSFETCAKKYSNRKNLYFLDDNDEKKEDKQTVKI
jgi:hypothetical protein